jgi:hypothetical protein
MDIVMFALVFVVLPAVMGGLAMLWAERWALLCWIDGRPHHHGQAAAPVLNEQR